MSHSIRISLTLACNQERAWQAIADWEGQGSWMLQSKVWVTSQIREGVGTSIAAFTGPFYKSYPKFAKLGLLDTMVVTNWQPPIRCDVLHTGKVLKGTGTFELIEISQSATRFNWSEDIECSRLQFLAIYPFLWIGVRISLARLSTSLRPPE
ncbi:SRPBCC domain containing protein [Candidatus Nanopelagicaceae bacterium]